MVSVNQQNRKVVITGSARRIGADVAYGLAQNGCDVVIHYRSHQEEAFATAKRLEDLGVRAAAFPGDFTQSESVRTFAQDAIRFLGTIDSFIHGASPFPYPQLSRAQHSIIQEDERTFDEAIAVNAKAAFILIQEFAPYLLQSTNPTVFTLLDSSIRSPFTSRAGHTVGKFALLGVTRLTASTYTGQIRVNGLELGRILPPDGLGSQSPALLYSGTSQVTDTIIRVMTDGRTHDTIIPIG